MAPASSAWGGTSALRDSVLPYRFVHDWYLAWSIGEKSFTLMRSWGKFSSSSWKIPKDPINSYDCRSMLRTNQNRFSSNLAWLIWKWSVRRKSRDWQSMHRNQIRQIQSYNFEQHKLVGSWSHGKFQGDQQKEIYDAETSFTSDLPRAPNNRGSPLCSTLRICREKKISASVKLIVSYMKINPQ